MSVIIFKRAADWRFPAGLVVVAAVLLAAALPLGSAIQFGADEGMELSKGFIYAEHSGLVARLWNDQPALYSGMLGAAFKLFSPKILVARLVAVSFGALLTLSIWGIVSELADRVAGVWAAIFFLLSPRVLILLVSTMLEVPAFALALAAFWAVLVSRRRGSSLLLTGSALLFGCALNIKLTPVLMLPAFCLHWIFFESKAVRNCDRNSDEPGAGPASAPGLGGWKALAVWLAASAVVWLLLLCAIPPGANWALLWGSHAKAGAAFLTRNPEVYRFPPGEYFAAHAEGTLGAVLGCCVLARLRQWRALVFPAALALTALAAHSLHRPWWWYYWLHFAIPLSMLSGMGLHGLARLAGGAATETKRNVAQPLLAVTAISCLAATTVFQALPRFAAQYSELRNSPKVESDALLKEILKYKPRARWLYSLDAKYSFFSQIPSPPELAVLPLKRFYSGGITFPRIMGLLKEYKVEEILTTSEPDPDGQWARFLAGDYVQVFKDLGHALYIAKSILPEGARSP